MRRHRIQIFALLALLLAPALVAAQGAVQPRIFTPFNSSGGGSSISTPVSVANGGTGNANGDGLLATCTDSVGTDAYACSSTSTPGCPASLAASEPVLFVAGTANTGAATFDYCALGAKALVKTVGGISTALATGDILAKQPVLVRYNATDDNWKMISAVSTAGGSSTITSGTTATSGCIAGGLLISISNLVRCNLSAYYSISGAVERLGITGVDLFHQGGAISGITTSNAFLGIGIPSAGALITDIGFVTYYHRLYPVGIVAGGTNVPTASLEVTNLATAKPLIFVYDNSAVAPSTGATNTWTIKDGAIPQVGIGVLTTATMTAEAQAYAQGSMVHSATWTNAQVVALGASLTGDIKAFTIPAKHVVVNAYVIITGAASGTTTLTVSCGRTSASYIDYIVASDAQAAANTVYGDASAERGTNLTGYDLPSYTGTTDVYCHFISTGSNLSAVTGSTGRVVLVTTLLP